MVLIALEIPVEKIPYVRTIEGRKFKNGKWLFPESSAQKLISLGLLSSEIKIEPKKEKQYELSGHLYGYQKKICNDALNAGSYGIFCEVGTGKTVISLEIADHYNKILVLCPLSIIESAWIDDCRRFYPHKKIINCHADSKQERIDRLRQDADIYVMNYESFKILYNEILRMDFDCMIVDESSCMKNMGAQITEYILRMIDKIPHRFVLSGTPAPNRFDEIFPQMKFVNSDIFGNNRYGFLQTYSHQSMKDPHVWYQTEDDKERFYARLSKQAVFLKKEDCIDLPEKVFEVRRFDMAKQQRQYYDDLVNDIRENINQWSKFEFTAKLMKLREVTSGFVINKDGSVSDFENSKEQLLDEVLKELGGRQVIVWCQFQHEIDTLAAKFGGVGLTSKTNNRDDIIRDFKEGRTRLLFTHPKLVGKGLTFTGCTYNVYYSLSFSYEEFKQSQDRIHRIGQNDKCTYIILQARNSIEEKMYDCVQRKGNAVDELYLEMGMRV